MDNLSQWGLRGYAAGADVLMPEIIDRIKNEKFGVVIFDPLISVRPTGGGNLSR